MYERICSNLVKSARAGIFAVVAMSPVGCAGASVSNQASSMPVRNNRPSTAYVYPFAVTAQDVTLNQGFFQKTYRDLSDENQTQNQLLVAQNTALAMASAMVQETPRPRFHRQHCGS